MTAYHIQAVEESQVITLELLSEAIQNEMGLDEDAANNTAEYILNFFGYDTEILDNILRPNDRSVFYLLYDVGLLRTTQENAVLDTGRNWRIFYWILAEDRIIESATEEEDEEDEISVYDMISTEEWFQH